MNSKRIKLVSMITVVMVAMLAAVMVKAQTISVLTTGLRQPAKVILTEQGNLLVAEEGFGTHDGRISIIDAQTGTRRTLLDGLPSAAGRVGQVQGPSGLVMRGRTLYLTIGEGNSTVPCAPPCFQVPNPSGPASPIFSSILALHFSAHTEMVTNGFTVTLADDFALKNGDKLKFDNGGGDKASLELVADFTDFAPDPLPGALQNVFASNPFGIELIANHAYVADGGGNRVWKVDIHSGEIETLVSFPTIILPSGRRIEAVPDGIRVYNNQLLVTLLRSFAPGFGEVRIVDPATGADAPFITGLTTAIDVIPVQTEGNPDYFYVLQFGQFAPPIGPGNVPSTLLRFDSPAGPPLSTTVLGPKTTSMTRDPFTGDLFMTRIFLGQLIRVQGL